MAEIVCTLKEFTYFIDPRIRANITSMTRRSKGLLGSKCQKCQKKATLDAAHKHGSSRKDIVKKVMEKYKTGAGRYEIRDLQAVLGEINDAHLPVEEHFVFLCQSCHREYDSWTKSLGDMEGEMPQDAGTSLPPMPNRAQSPRRSGLRPSGGDRLPRTQVPHQKKSVTGERGVTEILCKKEVHSWRYKIGWTSAQNRKNILELIPKIESSFDCYPVAFKSWYFHRRKDNGRQFCAIKTNKNDSEICFRAEPGSFAVDDSRIIHNKRWFFSEGKEKRVAITPQNHGLILQCLSHAFEASK